MPYTRVVWPEENELARLVRAAQRGEGRALDALLTVLRPVFVACVGRRLAPDVAEDLAQSALLRTVRALPTIDPQRARRYLITIARNLLRTEFRRRARDSRRSADAALADTVASPPRYPRAEYEELVRAVERASANTLSPDLRGIVLGLLRGLTPSEIASELGLKPVTVRTRLLRARALLRQELAPYLESGLRTGGLIVAALIGVGKVC
jgi:RNA polymerase sigma-70 factor (ECF subfamily)